MTTNEKIFDTKFMNAWILLEKHNECNCSYCEKRALEPNKLTKWNSKSKAKNSWTVYAWNKNNYYYYLRYTKPSLKWFFHISKFNNGWRLQIMSIHGKALLSLCPKPVYKTKIPWIESLLYINTIIYTNSNEENVKSITGCNR